MGFLRDNGLIKILFFPIELLVVAMALLVEYPVYLIVKSGLKDVGEEPPTFRQWMCLLNRGGRQ